MADNLLQEIDFNVVSRLQTLGFSVEEMSSSVDFTVDGLIHDAAMQARFAYEAIRAYEQAVLANENTEELRETLEATIENLEHTYDTLYALIPTKVSQLTNDRGFIAEETDPTVPDWAKEAEKPQYSWTEIVGLHLVAGTGMYDDLEGKPDIPPDLSDAVLQLQLDMEQKADLDALPVVLPNPYPLTINGTDYDGTEEVELTIGSTEYTAGTGISIVNGVISVTFADADNNNY